MWIERESEWFCVNVITIPEVHFPHSYEAHNVSNREKGTLFNRHFTLRGKELIYNTKMFLLSPIFFPFLFFSYLSIWGIMADFEPIHGFVLPDFNIARTKCAKLH